MIVKTLGKGHPRVAIVGCVHGDEIIGKQIISALENLELEKGSLKLVIANTLAMSRNVRFIDADLNRVFPGKSDGNHEEKLAYRLKKELSDSEYVIDIHSTTAKTPSFIIVTKRECLYLARLIPIRRVVLMTDKLAKGRALIDHVKCGISIEFSKYIPRKIALDYIKVALSNLGLIRYKTKTVMQEIYEAYDIMYKPPNFRGSLRNFRLKKKGSVIGHSNGKPVVSTEDFYPIFFGEKAYKNILCIKTKKVFNLI